MTKSHAISRYKDGLDDVGSLIVPLQWRMDARHAQSRPIPERPWHDEELQVPLEVVKVNAERVLYWDNDSSRENSLRRTSYMLASRAIPLVVMGGNTMRNLLDRLGNTETAVLDGYGFSRVMLARRVLMHLQTEPDQRSGHYRGANLHVLFRYRPPQLEALDEFVGMLRNKEGE